MEKKLTAYFRSSFGILLVCLLTLFAILPLTQPGFWPMHDDEQVGRLYELDNAVKAGHFPPRIATNLGFGYGYPLFNFYPPSVYYIAEVFVLLGFSYITSIELMIGLGFILAAVFMYVFAKEYWGEAGAIVAAVAYTYAPYHAVDVYVRGALPEFWSFVFIPLLFWSFKKIADTGWRRYLVISAIGISLLILTHNLVALMSAFFLGVYVLFLLYKVKDKRQFSLDVLLSGVVGLLLPAYFWIPSYVEKQYTMIELLTTELADYRQHFVYLRQLWDSPWGYGGSLFGLTDGLSFQIGKIHIVASLITGISLAVLFIVRRKIISIGILFFLFFLFSVFMISFYSQLVWAAIPQLSYIQFPWRFLLFAAFSGSFLLGAFSLLPIPSKYRGLIGCIFVVVLIVLNVSYFQPIKYLKNVSDQDYTANSVIRWRTSVMAFEYVPRGIATKTSGVGTTVIDITEKEIAQGVYQPINGTMDIQIVTDKPQEKKLLIQAKTPGTIMLNTYAFPGWKVFIDEKEVNYTANNKFKLMTIRIPQGEHTLRASFTNTPIRLISNILSLGGLLILSSILLQGRTHKKRV